MGQKHAFKGESYPILEKMLIDFQLCKRQLVDLDSRGASAVVNLELMAVRIYLNDLVNAFVRRLIQIELLRHLRR